MLMPAAFDASYACFDVITPLIAAMLCSPLLILRFLSFSAIIYSPFEPPCAIDAAAIISPFRYAAAVLPPPSALLI